MEKLNIFWMCPKGPGNRIRVRILIIRPLSSLRFQSSPCNQSAEKNPRFLGGDYLHKQLLISKPKMLSTGNNESTWEIHAGRLFPS